MDRRSFVHRSGLALGATGITALAGCNGGADSATIEIVSSKLHQSGSNALVWGKARNASDQRIDIGDTAVISVEFLDDSGEVLFSGKQDVVGVPAGGEFDFDVPYQGEKGHLVSDYNIKTELVHEDGA